MRRRRWTFDAEREGEEEEREYWKKCGRRMSPVREEELWRARRLGWFLEGVEEKRAERASPCASTVDELSLRGGELG